MTLVHLVVKLREVGYIFRVGLQDIGGLQSLDVVLGDIGDPVLEEERVDALVLVVGPYGDEQHVEGVHAFGPQGFQDVVPSEWEQFSAAFPERFRDIRHTYGYGYHLVLFV